MCDFETFSKSSSSSLHCPLQLSGWNSRFRRVALFKIIQAAKRLAWEDLLLPFWLQTTMLILFIWLPEVKLRFGRLNAEFCFDPSKGRREIERPVNGLQDGHRPLEGF